MIFYLIKAVLCSGLLLLVYYLFLEKEKMYHFNRFYLLFSLVFSFVVPLIAVPVQQPELLPVTETFIQVENNNTIYPDVIPINQEHIPHSNSKINFLPSIILVLYSIITGILLFRFARNMVILFSIIRHNKYVPYLRAKLVLTNEKLVPHSFLHFIFLNKEDYEKGLIEKEIRCHELTHVQQKHSLDIVFIELLLICCWFNPALHFYRKAIRLNHEFLADDAVVETFQNPVYYQQMLIVSASQNRSLLPTSPFNYSITKKRLIMMTKKTSPAIVVAKQIALLPLIVAAIVLFSTRTVAQVQDTAKSDIQPDTKLLKQKKQPQEGEELGPGPWVRLSVGSTKEGVTPEQMQEYETIISKYKTEDKWWHTFSNRISDQDRISMETIFKQMNLEQQGKQFLIFMKPLGPLPRAVPTQTQFEAFKDSKVYGVWINSKHVNNTALHNYTNTDFAEFYVSKLYGAAKAGRNYTHQLDMMTNDYYQNYYNQTMANSKSHIGFALNNHPVDSLREKFRLHKASLLEKMKAQSAMYRNIALLETIPRGSGAIDVEMDQYNTTLQKMLKRKTTTSSIIDIETEAYLTRLASIYYRMNDTQRKGVLQSTRNLILSLQQPAG